MTFADDRVRGLWARTRVRTWPERYVLASLPLDTAGEATAWLATARPGFAALVLEREELSLTLPETAWRPSPLPRRARAEAGPFRVLTFDLDLDLDVVGYLAPAAAALAAAGVPVVPQCAYSRDHLLVPDDALKKALAALEALIETARQAS